MGLQCEELAGNNLCHRCLEVIMKPMKRSQYSGDVNNALNVQNTIIPKKSCRLPAMRLPEGPPQKQSKKISRLPPTIFHVDIDIPKNPI
jgi:hypothetical protein